MYCPIYFRDGGRTCAQRTPRPRHRIVDAAYQSFWRSGFTRTSVDGIRSARAEVTKRTVYAYFRSKRRSARRGAGCAIANCAAERRKHIGVPDACRSRRSDPCSYFGQLVGWASTTPCAGRRSGFHTAGRRTRRSAGHPARASRQAGARTETEASLAGKLATCAGSRGPSKHALRNRLADAMASIVADADPWRSQLHRLPRHARQSSWSSTNSHYGSNVRVGANVAEASRITKGDDALVHRPGRARLPLGSDHHGGPRQP